MATGTWNRYVLAGWWSRVFATVVDSLAGSVAFGLLFGIAAALDAAGAPAAAFVPFSVSGVLSLWLVPAITMAVTNGQSLGKMAAQIRVVRIRGEPTNLAWSVSREWPVKAILLLTIVLDHVWPLWDRENRALHDMVMGSRVVRADVGQGNSRSAKRPAPSSRPSSAAVRG